MDKIILKGFYGFGNFGDDILMLTTYRLTKEIFPKHEIIICSESKNASYIAGLLENSVQIIDNDTTIKAEWIIHGGGGVFFDFKKGEAKFRWLNKAIHGMGYAFFRKSYDLYRKLKGYKGTQATFRAGLGIGIGTYTASSSKFYIDILSLSDFDFLLVRDAESLRYINEFNFNYPVYCASDMAFLHELWNLKQEVFKKNKNNVIGFVLRDWIFDDNAYLETLLKVALQLSKQGYDLKFYSFDKTSDLCFVKEFTKHFSILVWDPHQMNIPNFLREMSECSLMISSRAHGAIVSACLGIPVICLGIEPKLTEIFNMISNSAIFIQPILEEQILLAVQDALQNIDALQKAVSLDAKHNQEVMKSGIAIFREFINQSSRT